MPGDLILAIDLGTTGVTCLLVDADLRVVGRKNHEFPQHFPRPGWVEHAPEDWWSATLRGIADVLEGSGLAASRIRAIGITNQRETALIWSRRDGRPIHRAIVWQDRRTTDRCQALREEGWLPDVQRTTGLVLDPYFSATKFAWMLDNVQDSREAAERGELAAGTVDTYMLWRLTGGRSHATEASNASRTSLWPLSGGGWSEALCELFSVPLALLPEVLPADSCFGTTLEVPGLPDGIPIHGILGDQQAALFGQGCHSAGQAKCTYGTGAFIVLNTGPRAVPSRHGLLTSVAWQIGAGTQYCLEGSAFMAGAVVQWLRDELKLFATSAEVEALAGSVPDSGGVTLVPGHTGLGAPHWRPEARGLIRGLTRGTGRAHLARAALEGIGLQIADLVDAMAADAGAPLRRLRVDGGAAANDLLMQIQSDLLGVPLERPRDLESTALGAAALAGLGSGLWPSLASLHGAFSTDATFVPNPAAQAEVTALRKRWKVAVEQA